MNILFTPPLNRFYSQKLLVGVLGFISNHPQLKLRIHTTSPALALAGKATFDGILGSAENGLELGPDIPTVNVYSSPSPGIPQVCVDDHVVCQKVFDHLHGRGVESFAFIHYENMQVSAIRRDIFTAICRNHGYPCVVLSAKAEWDMRKKINDSSFTKALRDVPKPLGAMAYADFAGSRLATICQELGMDVPNEVAIVGVNNYLFLDEFTSMGLSTVDIGLETIGYNATRTLLQLINGKPVPSKTLLPPRELIARQSSKIELGLDPNLTKALDYIKDHFNEPIETEDIVRQQALCRRALEYRFKHRFGMTPMEYLRNLRMMKVKFLLENTNLTIEDISKEAGFSTSNYLCRLFRRVYDSTPTEYRKKFRGVSGPFSA